MPFGTEKLEWWGYQMVKTVRRYVYEHKVHLVECYDVIAVDEHCKRGLSEDVFKHSYCRLNVVCSFSSYIVTLKSSLGVIAYYWK